MQSKFETFQINLLCDEQVGMIGLPKVALESLAAAAEPRLKSIIMMGGRTDQYSLNARAYALNPTTREWHRLIPDRDYDSEIWPYYGGVSYSYATPLADGSVFFTNAPTSNLYYRALIFEPLENGMYRFSILPDNVRNHMCRPDSKLATMRDGTVVCVGGFSYGPSAGDNNVLTTFNPRTDECTTLKSNKHFPNAAFAVALPDNTLLVCGGLNRMNAAVTNDAFIVDLEAATVREIAPMQADRCFHAGCLLDDGRVFVHGGGGGIGFIPTYEIYDPSSGVWTQFMPGADPSEDVVNLSWDRTNHTCVQLPDGKIFISADPTRLRCFLLDLPTNMLTETSIPVTNITGCITVPVYE